MTKGVNMVNESIVFAVMTLAMIIIISYTVYAFRLIIEILKDMLNNRKEKAFYVEHRIPEDSE